VIMAATEQLLIERGHDVSSREIAAAAGIAEGTIFRVFPTKDAIIDAIFADVFDARSDWDQLAAKTALADFKICLIELVGLLQRRLFRMTALFAAVGFRQTQSEPQMIEQRRLNYEALAAVLRPHAHCLRTDPDDAARVLNGLAVALTHPMFTDRPVSDPEEIVEIFLHGNAARPEISEASEC
jgi:AcrR family transcriptional regulator